MSNLEKAYYLYFQNLCFEGVKEFCWKLNRVFNTHFSYRYIYSLLKGYKGFRVTEQIDQAALALLANPPPSPAVKIIANVMSFTDLPPGTIIIANAVACSGPKCKVIFIPPYANQKYCSKECKQKARNIRRRRDN